MKDDINDVVSELRARVTEIESQLEALRLRLASAERTLASVVQLDAPAFREAARAAYDQLNEAQKGFIGVVSIADLRRALGPRISREAFDSHLIKLHDDGILQLMAHPGTVRDAQQKDALVHPKEGSFYYLRWERRS